MTTWIDTNVLVALWSGDADAQADVRRAMEKSAEDGWFAVGGCVYAEFLAGPGRSPEAVSRFLSEAEIPIAWQTGEDVWLLAATDSRTMPSDGGQTAVSLRGSLRTF